MQIVAALIEALQLRGVRRVYGVPGDYVLGLFAALQASPIDLICTAGEEGAGFAADAHGRLQGLGVAVVTYGVGASSPVPARRSGLTDHRRTATHSSGSLPLAPSAVGPATTEHNGIGLPAGRPRWATCARCEHQHHGRELRTGSAQIAAGGGAIEPQRSIRVALSRLVINAGIGEALTRDPCG